MEYPISAQDRECMATRTEYFFSDYSVEPKLAVLRPLVEFDRVWCASEVEAHLVARWYQDNGFRARRAGSKVVVMVKVQ